MTQIRSFFKHKILFTLALLFIQNIAIAQEKNKNGLPLYGVDVMGKQWSFVTMEGKDYCISKTFDAADKQDLLTIVAVLRKFKYILETRLLDKN